MNRVLFKNIISLVSLRGLEYVLSLILIPFLVRVLGPERYGAVSLMQGVIAYFIIFIDYGFNMTAPKTIAQVNEKDLPTAFSTFCIAKIILAVGITSIFGIGYLICMSLFACEFDLMLFFAVYMVVIGNIIFPIWFFQGIQKMQYITIVNVLARIITVISIFYFVRFPSDYICAAFLQSCTPVFAGIFSFIIIYRKFHDILVIPTWGNIMHTYKEGWNIFISTLAINLYTSSNIIILGIFTNNTVVGYYSGASKIIEVVKKILEPISQAIYPHVCLSVRESKERTIEFLHKVLMVFMLGGGSFSFMLFFGAGLIVNIILGNQYHDSIVILKIMAFVPCMVSLSNVFGMLTLLPFNKEKEYSRILIVSAILNTIVIIPLTVVFGAIGTAATMLLTESFVTLAMGAFLYKLKLFIW